ncbi:hypothetical protein RI129_006601 [Pyrocoelia pectoralis]|uniref:Uncharacterized protein n=1 Tax=Pyrocoelia pectoralis TaxID=417401 RepID=A0AAN7VHF5_9COLE
MATNFCFYFIDDSCDKQTQELQLRLKILLDEKKTIARLLTKSEDENNSLINEIAAMRIQRERKTECVRTNSDKRNEDILSDFNLIKENLCFLENLLNTGREGRGKGIEKNGHQSNGFEDELTILKENVTQMEQFVNHLKHYLDFADKRKLHLTTMRDKLKNMYQNNDNRKLCDHPASVGNRLPPLRRPKIEFALAMMEKDLCSKFTEDPSDSSSVHSLDSNSFTIIPHSTPKVTTDLSLTDCQKMMHQQKITIDELTTKIDVQNRTISQLTQDNSHFRSQETRMLGVERQNNAYYISIVKLMAKNDELLSKIFSYENEHENKDENLTDNDKEKTVSTCDPEPKDQLDIDINSNINTTKSCQTVTMEKNDDDKENNKNAEDAEKESIIKNLMEKDLQQRVYKDVVNYQNDILQSLEKEKHVSNHQMDLLKIEINHLMENKAELMSEIENLKHSNETLNSSNVNLSCELQQLQNDLHRPQFTEKLETLERENLNLTMEYDRVVAENNDTIKKFDNLRNCIASFKPHPRAYVRKVEQLKCRLVKIKNKYLKKNIQRSKFAKKLCYLQSQYQQLCKDHEAVNLQKDTLVLQVYELQKHKDKLISTLEASITEKQKLEFRLNKRSQSICACCLKLNRDYITLKGNIQQLHDEINKSQQAMDVLKKHNVGMQTKLDNLNERMKITSELLQNEKRMNDKLLSDQMEIKSKTDKEKLYLEYKYGETIDKLGKDKAVLQNDLNEFEKKYINLSELSEKENQLFQNKIMDLIYKNSALEETLKETSKKLTKETDIVLQLTTELEEQNIQLELLQQNNSFYKHKMESICAERELVEQQLKKTINHLKKSELKYFSMRKVLIDTQSHVAGDSRNLTLPSDKNSEIFNLSITLKHCQDELYDVKDKLSDSLTLSNSLEGQISNANVLVNENKQKLNRSIVMLVTSWRGVLENVMNVQVILDQLAAVNLKTFAHLDETISQLQKQTCVTTEILEALVSCLNR